MFKRKSKYGLKEKIEELKVFVRRNERLKVIKEVNDIITEAQLELDESPVDSDGVAWVFLEAIRQKVLRLGGK